MTDVIKEGIAAGTAEDKPGPATTKQVSRTLRLIENPLPHHLRGWTLAEVRTMREMAEQGQSAGEIARHLRRTKGAIRSRANAHGIRVKA